MIQFSDLMEQVLEADTPNKLEIILRRALYDAWMDGAWETAEDFTRLGVPQFDCPFDGDV